MTFDQAYHVVIIALLLVIIWKLTRVETYVGGGNTGYKSLTSGADLRFAQQFTSTDQDTTNRY
jgi:hypothetical protein